MDLYSSTYENFIFLGDFNADMEHSALKDFYNLHFVATLISKTASRKNPSKPSCIDLILTNCQKFFRTPIRQVIILHNLANRVTFVFLMDMEHWNFSPWVHFQKSIKVTWQLTLLSTVSENWRLAIFKTDNTNR